MDKKIKVAIIDSGILGSRNYQISESIHFYVIGEDIMTNQDVEDFCGHGTACAHMIHRLCTDVEFKIVKVFDSTLFTHPALIVCFQSHQQAKLCKPEQCSRQMNESEESASELFEAHSDSAMIFDLHEKAFNKMPFFVVIEIGVPWIN